MEIREKSLIILIPATEKYGMENIRIDSKQSKDLGRSGGNYHDKDTQALHIKSLLDQKIVISNPVKSLVGISGKKEEVSKEMESASKRKGSKAASVGFLVQDEFMVHSPHTTASSLIKKEGMSNSGGHNEAANGSEVDKRAAKFISYVQERFRLERIDEDWRK
ncbi:hypothetical protein Cni_G06150 [Canna indica]|uniref:Uncharacterized protein n=1 Tax=Canna indica TaxID=4628 RepID=A0AAQ3JYV0_9LILI|nr:hypothetical protein Cni_G06150 [Canna indica]